MKGLLLKEFYLLKSLSRSYLTVLTLFLVLTLTGVYQITLFSSMAVLLLTMIPLSTFSLDEIARWERFAAATPAGRNGVVGAKYLFTLAMAGGTLLLTSLVNLLILVLRPEETSAGNLFLSSLICVCVGLLMAGLLLPLAFWLGAQKSRILLTVIMGLVFAALMLGLIFLKGLGVDLSAQPGLVFFLPGLGPVFFVVSYPISQRIYARRAL